VSRFGCTFVAFSFETLAISESPCFHEGSNANTEEVHMDIKSKKRQMPKLCTTAAVGDRALLG
jgi:hypothetical protein